ncbi:hypothetical protein [Marinobacter sp.]|uniref:hypothetical protein n=1 Tax=Marinobacter sp. TaxID=50741 RepID=UPI0019CA3028|nr:hypothetical protein [Marinobacter sp.]MBC7193908.1 hypothetical protein [Marinobacter sp.]
MYAIRVVELKNGAKTIEKKEELRARGFKYVAGLDGKCWAKRVETVEEAKEVIRDLNGLGFGTSFGTAYQGMFLRHREAQEKGIDLGDAPREIYFFQKENNLL